MKKIIRMGLLFAVLLAFSTVASATPPLHQVKGTAVVVSPEDDPWPVDPFRIKFNIKQIDEQGTAKGTVLINGLNDKLDGFLLINVLKLVDHAGGPEMAGVVTQASNEEDIGKGFYGFAGIDIGDNDYVFYTIPESPDMALLYVELHIGGDARQVVSGNIKYR